MKAGIFDPYLDTLGGGERYCLSIAEYLLKKGWTVDLFWNDESIEEKIKTRFALDIGKINFIDYSPYSRNIFQRTSVEARYDLLFYFSDGSVPFMFGKKNLLHFQVPFKNVLGRSFKNYLKLKKIDKVVCNSLFTKKVIDRGYGTNSDVWYPPVDVEEFFSVSEKENFILAVGRFEKSQTEKRQDVLIDVFKKMVDNGLKNWKLVLAGGSVRGGKNDELLNELKKTATDYPIDFKTNISFSELKNLYAKSKIFWHAAGYGIDEEKNPERVEHFGMTTVEAMAAGCVPVVQGKGGQKEIIDNGEDGFLWIEKEELEEKTLRLIKDESLIKRLSKKTIEKSKNFSKERFYQKFCGLIK